MLKIINFFVFIQVLHGLQKLFDYGMDFNKNLNKTKWESVFEYGVKNYNILQPESQLWCPYEINNVHIKVKIFLIIIMKK